VSDRAGRWAWGLSARLIVSYVLVTLAVVVLVETIVLGYQAPRLVNDTRLQAQVGATATSYLQQLTRRYPGGALKSGPPLLGDPGQPPRPGHARLAADGSTLVIPAISGPIGSDKAVTAAVVITPEGKIIASSAPSRYPPGRPAAQQLPNAATVAIAAGPSGHAKRGAATVGSGSTPNGRVSWALTMPAGGDSYYLYVQAPQPTGFLNPIRAWHELRRLSDTGPILTASYVLLIAIVPVGVLFGLLATRRTVRRVRRLEQAAVAVADGDYTVSLPTTGRDEIGRLEANFTTMTRQLGSALAAERQRAGSDARTAERTRLAREIHDAISQHLFGLRMIAAGMRKADPDNQPAQSIERITEEALRDIQALLLELRSASLDEAGLAPALQEICTAYRDRLGVPVDADLDDVTVPEPVAHGLLRITQEACTNAIRHGNAGRLGVSLTHRDGHVELAVRDTGTGFDPAAPHPGSGLAHIRGRVTELGGTLDIDSTPGRGAALTVRVPMP
jgi:signal transduction histidine kinase